MKSQLRLLMLGLVLSSQLFFACQPKDEVVVPTPTPTPIPTPTLTKSAGYFVTAGKANPEFDLGELHGSNKYLFSVANGGDEDIFNVTLSSDNAPFEISPKNISTIPGKLSGGVVPVLTVGITHGLRLNGVGIAPTLPKGPNQARIKLKGKTLSGKDTIEVTGEFIVKVEAKVMDAKVLSGDVEAIVGTNSSGTPPLVVEPAKTVKLVNTGNVTIQASIQYNKYELIGPDDSPGGFYQVKNQVELQPGETKDITSIVSLASGKGTQDGKNFYYPGQTSISFKDAGVVSTTAGFTLYSK